MIASFARWLAGIGWVFPLLLIACRGDAAAMSCTEAAAAAEAATPLPPGLLLAIGIVESGRTDATGKRSPWPWTINAGGAGHFFDSAAAAVLAVQSLRASGLTSIDIGCFQINLLHHPDAFPDLASGFDPLTNAHAATDFLLALRAEFGGWDAAIAAYHSRSDMLGPPFRDLVTAAWHGGPAPWHTTPIRRNFSIAGVRIWGPDGELDLAPGLSPWPLSASPAVAARARLPRVITAWVR